jgi:hypothetical protein
MRCVNPVKISVISPEASRYLGGEAAIKRASGDRIWARRKDIPGFTPSLAASRE